MPAPYATSKEAHRKVGLFCARLVFAGAVKSYEGFIQYSGTASDTHSVGIELARDNNIKTNRATTGMNAVAASNQARSNLGESNDASTKQHLLPMTLTNNGYRRPRFAKLHRLHDFGAITAVAPLLVTDAAND